MINDNLIWLLNWYHSQCDWEHGNGIQIATIDNPGWYLKVSLEETELQAKQFQKIRIDRSEHDWIRCFIENGMFEGVGGPLNLPEVLQIFRDWAENKTIQIDSLSSQLLCFHHSGPGTLSESCNS